MRELWRPAADVFVEVDGARLRLRDEGQGFPVLLVHGWALDLDMWDPQAAAWAARLRVIRFDRRGFGLSSGQPGLAADARDIESLLRRLNLSRVAILGMSQGARAALAVATGPLRPRVACLILDGAPFDLGEEAEPEVPLERYRELLRRVGVDAVRREWRAHPFTRLRTDDRAARELVARMIARYPAADLLARSPPPRANGGSAAGVRTLVLNGACDTPRRRAMGDELARSLPGAERALIPDAGHLPNLDRPVEYNRRVLSFIDRHAFADQGHADA
jgi:pimeloyl-ACP methyl ester carboxylesterase